ncbi:MAG: alpha/beta hydrolase [Bacteroidales bacterium]|nr:alpha/beta hydrolase [Bacteroidales bacterium]
MKRSLVFVLCLFLITRITSSQNIVDNKAITGSWMGKIAAGAISLRVIFNISLADQDSLTATLDSPDQGVTDIKIGPVTFDGRNLNIKAPLLLGEYTGTLKNDTIFEGTWIQAGKSSELNLTRLKSPLILIRPQEPKPPFPYSAEDVTFKNQKHNIILAGTLTIPEGNGPFPAVVLITGSGAQNRDEEIMGHKPFHVIADHLSRNDIAVLRYDDRGVGRSQGNYSTATSADLATDAEAALKYLRSIPKVNPELTGLAGHSEGGFIAPMIAASDHETAFIISLAGTGVTGEKILMKQNYDIGKASGISEKQLSLSLSANKKLFSIIKKEPDNEKAIEEMRITYRKILEKEKISPEDEEAAMKELENSFGTLTSHWFRYFLVRDPAVFWKRVKCPVLAINGTMDLQVNADINLKAISKALRSGGNTKVTIIKPEGLNHLFQHSSTGSPQEYGEIEVTISPEILKTMSEWINGLK